MKNIKVASLNIKFKDLFEHWLKVTRIFNGLTNSEISVLALLLYYYYEFKKDITNESILWKVVFDYDTKMLIKEELGITDQNLQNKLTVLRRKGVIKDNRVNSVFIPEMTEGTLNFKVVFNYNIVYD